MKHNKNHILFGTVLSLGLFLGGCSDENTSKQAEATTADQDNAYQMPQSPNGDQGVDETEEVFDEDVSTPTLAFASVFQSICKFEEQFNGGYPEGLEIYLDLTQTELLDDTDKDSLLRRAQAAVPYGVNVVAGTWDDLIAEGRTVVADESGVETMENVINITLTERNFINEMQFTIANTSGGTEAYTEYTVTLDSATGEYSTIMAGGAS